MSPAPTHAQEAAGAPAGYDELIKRAVVEFDNSHWAEARALFGRAHELAPNARTYRGLGITAFELRRYVDATRELDASLTDTNKPLTPKQRDEVQGLLARAREFVAVFTLQITPRDAELLVDGAPAKLDGDRLAIDPGPHRLLLKADGYRDRELQLSVDPGQKRQLVLVLEPIAQAPVAPSVVSADTGASELREPTPERRRVWTWVFAGAAAGTGAAGVAMRLIARGESEDHAQCVENCDDLRNDGQRHERVANVLFGVAGGLAVASIASFFIEGRANSERPGLASQLLLRPYGATFTHRF